MLTVNERTTAYLTVSFRDKLGALAVPTSVTYRIDCITTGTAILASTDLGTPATSMEVTLTPAQNAVITTSNATEHRRVTFVAVYGASDQVTSFYDYQVKNLTGVS